MEFSQRNPQKSPRWPRNHHSCASTFSTSSEGTKPACPSAVQEATAAGRAAAPGNGLHFVTTEDAAGVFCTDEGGLELHAFPNAHVFTRRQAVKPKASSTDAVHRGCAGVVGRTSCPRKHGDPDPSCSPDPPFLGLSFLSCSVGDGAARAKARPHPGPAAPTLDPCRRSPCNGKSRRSAGTGAAWPCSG